MWINIWISDWFEESEGEEIRENFFDLRPGYQILKEIRQVQPFLMGADAPIPLVMISAAAPDGAPPRRINYRTRSLIR
jgi:hypothetical protein